MDRDSEHWEAVEEATELLHEERFREALELLHEVVKKDPQNPYAFFFTGQAFYEVGEMEPARDAYRACLRLAPKHLGVGGSDLFFPVTAVTSRPLPGRSVRIPPSLRFNSPF